MEDKRISRKQLEAMRHAMGEHEKSILRAIRKYKYMTTDQIRRLHFTAGTDRAALRRTNRTLAKLRDLGLLLPLPRRIGGVRSGSGAYIWALSAAGAKLLVMADGNEQTSRKRHHEPSHAFLTHTIAITETAIRLHEWDNAGKMSLLTLETEPENWRKYMGLGGAVKYMKPDLFAVTASGEYEDYYYLELDMATESPAVVLRKCEQYIAYRNTGGAQREHGIYPFVVWLVPDEKRKHSLQRHISDKLAEHASIFIAITMDELESVFVDGAEGYVCRKKD